MKKFFIITLLCSSAMQLYATDFIEKITLEKGNKIELSIPENKTTGYEWNIILKHYDIIKIDVESKQSSSERLGAPGTLEIEIEAKKPGTATLKLEYVKPWENKIPTETRTYTIVVKE